MNLFRWLFRLPHFGREPDSFTIKREQLWPQVLKAIRYQQQQGCVIWIVAHFADQFSEIQARLGQWQIEYQLVMKTVSPSTIVDMSRGHHQVVFLGLAELLSPATVATSNFDESTKLCIISIERHPLLDFDQRLENAVSQIPCRVKFGYYLALEDPVFGSISQPIIASLKQLGLKDDELINSYATTRSIERVQKKRAASYDATLRADSAREWMLLQEEQLEI